MATDYEHLLTLLLTEVRDFRTEVQGFRQSITDWQQETGERVATLETDVRSGIKGNGQPSRLSAVETRVTDLEHARWRESGVVLAVSSVLAIASHWLPWGTK